MMMAPTPFEGFTSLFYRTPQEHLNDMWKIIKTLPPNPPAQHVRVHLYPDWTPGCDDTEFVMRHSALVADFPLERSGKLKLARVRDKWALSGCAPIDPCRRAPFDTVHPEYLSPLAIRVLTDNGVLKLFEPKPSEKTLAMRHFRLRLVTACDNAMGQVHDATLGRLADTIGLLPTAMVLTVMLLGGPVALVWYLLMLSGWRWWGDDALAEAVVR